MKNNTDIKKAVDTIHSTIEEIKKGLKNSELSAEAASRLKDDAIQVELKAYKTKIGLQIHMLSKNSPSLSAKEVLLKLLATLPDDIKSDFLPILTIYILENWKSKLSKLAA